MQFQDLINQNRLFDSHCHLNAQQYDHDRDEVVRRAEEAGLSAIIDIGTDIESSKKVIENARKYDIVHASVGIDPEILIPGSDLFDSRVFDLDDSEFQKWLDARCQMLDAMAERSEAMMIGETGIDNYWLQQDTADSGQLTVEQKERFLLRQELLFRMHARLAKKYDKPLSIHSRNAIERCLRVLEDEKIPKGLAVFHSLTPDIDDSQEDFDRKVRKILSRGYYVAINAIATFKSAEVLRDVYKSILDNDLKIENFYKNNLIFETDGPFLAPAPHRGMRNEPGYVLDTFENLLNVPESGKVAASKSRR